MWKGAFFLLYEGYLACLTVFLDVIVISYLFSINSTNASFPQGALYGVEVGYILGSHLGAKVAGRLM